MSYDIRYITQFGDQVELTRSFNCSKLIEDTEYFKPIWSRYNPRKNIERYGLCVLNDKGMLGPGPALDSLWEYNNENGTSINETDCNIPTELYTDTTKEHTLFNASMKDSIWLVINALVCEESIEFVCKNLAIK